MTGIKAIVKRELISYFTTPLAYIFLIIFLMLMGVFSFYIGGFYERGQADLQPFFAFHPWLYLFLIPALSMRMWAEERKTGTIELLLTLPICLRDAILGKFIAAWLFTGIALCLTFPMWITVNYLGQPDNGVILAGYLGSWLMAGAFLSIGLCMSSITNSQVIAFVLTLSISFVFVSAGFPLVLDTIQALFPQWMVDAIASLSLYTHFIDISRGVLDARDVVYFILMIGAWLIANAIIIDMKKAG